MSTPTHSLLATVPAALHDKGNRLAWAIGYQPEDGDTFSILFSTPGGDRYGFIQFVMPSFIALLAAGKAGSVQPRDWSPFGLSEAEVLEVMAAIETDTRSVDAGMSLAQHMVEALAERPGWSILDATQD